jgi:hypothetical protein
MPQTTTFSGTTLVIGAGELGLAVIRGLLELHPEDAQSISVLLRPLTNGADAQVAKGLTDKGLKIVHGDLATEAVTGLASLIAGFET